MQELFFNKTRTCAVSGHRIITEKIDLEKLNGIFLKLIEGGYNTFLVGMALGFDTVCFHALEKIREKHDIKIVACIPCIKQDYKFNKEQKEEYERMVLSADFKVIISEDYTPYCMKKRNDYMIKNSSLLVAFLRENKGGTYYTVKRAEKENVAIIKI